MGFKARIKRRSPLAMSQALLEIFKVADRHLSEGMADPCGDMDIIRDLASSGLGMSFEQIKRYFEVPRTEDLELDDHEIQLIRNNRWVEAIKCARERLLLDLKTAKELIDEYRSPGHPHWEEVEG